ncbi:MAG TPA: CoF synthetase, partial [Paenibacillaceae bacterium]|nr:CoF synthetase [Paenibacillaceae bacterium]
MIRRFLFPAMEKFKGNNIQKNIAHLKHSQSLTKHELEILQKFKLKKLLLYCVDHVPAYSSYQSLKREIERDPLQALHRFPVLT